MWRSAKPWRAASVRRYSREWAKRRVASWYSRGVLADFSAVKAKRAPGRRVVRAAAKASSRSPMYSKTCSAARRRSNLSRAGGHQGGEVALEQFIVNVAGGGAGEHGVGEVDADEAFGERFEEGAAEAGAAAEVEGVAGLQRRFDGAEGIHEQFGPAVGEPLHEVRFEQRGVVIEEGSDHLRGGVCVFRRRGVPSRNAVRRCPESARSPAGGLRRPPLSHRARRGARRA